jgi:hypothetical protein
MVVGACILSNCAPDFRGRSGEESENDYVAGDFDFKRTRPEVGECAPPIQILESGIETDEKKQTGSLPNGAV